MSSTSKNRKRQNEQPMAALSPEPRKRWIEVKLGDDRKVGHNFSLSYDVTDKLPCVTLTSIPPPWEHGTPINLETSPGHWQQLSRSVTLPLRIFLDLLHVHLTHNCEKYLYGYTRLTPDQRYPQEYALRFKGDDDNVEPGCFHTVTVQPSHEAKALFGVPQSRIGNKGGSSTIPEVAPEHLVYAGTPAVTCTMARYPQGPMFIALKRWQLREWSGCALKMFDAPSDKHEMVFPLCHSEHLPGLVAAIHRWLKGDYNTMGLIITCAVPDNVTLIPKPPATNGYKYDLSDASTAWWPNVFNTGTMWSCMYDGKPVDTAKTYGLMDLRCAMRECPASMKYQRELAAYKAQEHQAERQKARENALKRERRMFADAQRLLQQEQAQQQPSAAQSHPVQRPIAILSPYRSKGWLEVKLGRNTKVGHTFSISYDTKFGMPYVTLTSNPPPQLPGTPIDLVTSKGSRQRFAETVSVPLRIFLDLLHVHLTHNEEKYLHLYPERTPTQRNPVDYAPRTGAFKETGCFHSVSVYRTPETEDRLRVPQHTVGNDNDCPKIPEVSPAHLVYPGIPRVTCTISKYSSGPMFLIIKKWHLTSPDRRQQTSMLDTPPETDELVFPLCHNEHLPGLVAVIHRWLKGDYNAAGLMIACAVYDYMSLVPKPSAKNGYKYDLRCTHRIWPNTANVQDMWATSYNDQAFPIEEYEGDVRNGMIVCPSSIYYRDRYGGDSDEDEPLPPSASETPLEQTRAIVHDAATQHTLPSHEPNPETEAFPFTPMPSTSGTYPVAQTSGSSGLKWQTVNLGDPTWGVGNAFTIRYDETRGPRCLIFEAKRHTLDKGMEIHVQTNSFGVPIYNDAVTVPVKIFLDLLTTLLTHNTDCEDDYYNILPTDEDPLAVMAQLPASCTDSGCHHEYLFDAGPPDASDAIDHFEGDSDDDDDDSATNNIARKPSRPTITIPRPDPHHYLTTGITGGVNCAMNRQPRGPVFITVSGWSGKKDDADDDEIVIMPSDFEELEHLFALCHTEHLPGFAAAVHKWLDSDYRTLGLSVTCHVPSDILLIPKPSVTQGKEGYRYTTADLEKYWPELSGYNLTGMRQTTYNNTPLSVEPLYGLCRPKMIKCPYSKRHCRPARR